MLLQTKIARKLKKGMSVGMIVSLFNTDTKTINAIRREMIAKGELEKGKAQLKAHKTRKLNSQRLLDNQRYDAFKIKAGAVIYVKKAFLNKLHALPDGNFILE